MSEHRIEGKRSAPNAGLTPALATRAAKNDGGSFGTVKVVGGVAVAGSLLGAGAFVLSRRTGFLPFRGSMDGVNDLALAGNRMFNAATRIDEAARPSLFRRGGDQRMQAVHQAIEEIEAAGGILGKQPDFVTQYAEAARPAAQRVRTVAEAMDKAHGVPGKEARESLRAARDELVSGARTLDRSGLAWLPDGIPTKAEATEHFVRASDSLHGGLTREDARTLGAIFALPAQHRPPLPLDDARSAELSKALLRQGGGGKAITPEMTDDLVKLRDVHNGQLMLWPELGRSTPTDDIVRGAQQVANDANSFSFEREVNEHQASLGAQAVDNSISTGRPLRSRDEKTIEAIETTLRGGEPTKVGRTPGRNFNGTLEIRTKQLPGGEAVKVVAKPAVAQAAQEEFAWRIGRRLGMDRTMPIVARDSDGVANIEFVAGKTLDAGGVVGISRLDGHLAKLHAADNMLLNGEDAARAARLDRQLLQFLDYLLANNDRHTGNGLVSATDMRFIDYGHMGRGATDDVLVPHLRSYQAGSRTGGTVKLDPETVEVIRKRLKPDDLRTEHKLLADEPFTDDSSVQMRFLGRVRSDEFREGMVARLEKVLNNGEYTHRRFSYSN